TLQDSLLTIDTPLRLIEGANDIGQILIGGSSGQESRQFSDGGTANSAERFNAPNQFEFSDEVFYSRGPHALQFGVTFHRMQHNFARPSRKRGAHEFTSLRNFIRVNPRRFRAGFGDPTKAMRRNYFATFIQDDFKATRNLTLNLGFRYEFMTTPTEASGDRISNFRHQFVDGLFVLRTEPFVGSPYWENNSYLSLAPRVGFAWDPFSDGSMAVRGGFGIFYDQGVDEYRGFVNNVPFFDTIEIRRPTPFPFGFAGGSGRSRSSPDSIDFDLKVPTRVTWNFGIERQITENTGFAIRYVGSQSYHLSRRSPGNTSIPERCNSEIPSCLGRSDGTLFYPDEDADRRNPDLGGNRYVTTDSVSAYHSLQWDLSQRFSKNLQYKISYTFSRNIDDASNPNSALVEGHPDMTQNPEDRAADRALSAYDVRNNLAANFSYTLPGTNLTGATAWLGGWQLGGIVSMSSGIPITAQTSFNRSLDQSRSTSDRPNLRAGFSNNPIEGVTAGCEGVAAGQKLGTPNLYYDPCAFELPPAGFYGNVGRSTIIGPGFANVDFSVTKIFSITENTRIDFRAEFFNLFNRANFDLPDAAMFDEDTETPLSTAGQIRSTATTSRQIQFGLKFTF
ncbi:MAG: hypothetical protein IH846_10050, partial [Acidobacteria bacterium]|nr:hypothetical protein [Acidobacteriota bacterium]